MIAAGSLLGTLPAAPKSYPVGMVNLLDIYPLVFDEFLEAVDPAFYTYYAGIQREQQIEDIFHKRLLEAYNSYLIIGGMPECVESWVKYKDPSKINQIQRELIEVYENDFSKHNGKVNSGRILMVFRSIASQLAKPNEKFMYGAVREGGRARDFEEAIEWLVSAGMLNRIYNVSKMEHPLSAFDKLDQFKLFVLDTVLLKHMLCFNMERKLSLLKQKAAKTNLHHLLRSTLPNISPNTHFDFQNAAIGKMDISPTSRYTSHEKQKNCCEAKLYYKMRIYPFDYCLLLFFRHIREILIGT